MPASAAAVRLLVKEVTGMTSLRRDLVATGLTALVVGVYAANVFGWSVWLVGDSVRWAAAVIVVLGVATCALGARPGDRVDALFGVLGVACAVFAVIALVTASSSALAALVAVDVALWVLATSRHLVHHLRHHGVPTPV
jgi:hypothetical protein